MATSDYMEQSILESILNSVAFPTITNAYIALHTTSPLDNGTGAECTGTNYARIDSGAFTSMTGITDGQTENVAEIAFAQASDATWGTITHIGIWDALTTGNILYHGALTASKTIGTNDTFKIAAGALTVTLDAP